MNLLRLCAVLLLAPPASAQRAMDDFDHERYEAAAEGFGEAYSETDDLGYLYAQAKSLQSAGDCESAVPLFQAFIVENPIPAAGEEAQKNLTACGATARPIEPVVPHAPPRAEADPVPPTVDTPAVAPRFTDDVEPTPPPPRSWYRDPLGGVLAGIGIAGIAAGATLAGVARRSQGQADGAGDVESFGRNNDRAVTLSTASIPVLVVGGAVVAAAVFRYARVARGRSTPLATGSPSGFTLRF